MRFPDRFACRACVAVIAGLATVVVTPAVGAGQPARGQGRQDTTVGARNLVLGGADATTDLAPVTVPRGYALVIGVGDYPNLRENEQLPFAESDALEMYRVLISQEGGAFPPQNVRVLTGRQASLAAIRRELEEWLPSVAQPADRVAVYFVGHGFVKDGRGYLAPSDVDRSRLEETAYPMAALGDVMANRVQARWKVLFTDACHSGKITPETTNEALDRQWGSLPQDFLTFTAAREREQAYYDARLSTGFGFFTYYLTRALLGEADNDPCDGRVTADEVVEYVRTHVRQHARGRGLSQTPSEKGDFEGEMLLGVNIDGGLACGDPLSPSLQGTAVVEVNLDDVDVFVDGEFRGTASGDEPLRLPGLPGGEHEVMGVRRGYEPVRRLIMIAPGQEVGVELRILYPERRVEPEARRLNERGEALLRSRRSTTNPLDVWFARSQDAGDLEDARERFAEALAEDPGYARAAGNLGHVLQLLQRHEESRDAYESVLRINPSDVDARVGLAGVLLELGDEAGAMRHLTEAQRLGEPTHELYARMATVYWRAEDWQRARTSARRAIELDESSFSAHLYEADALRRLAADEALPTVKQSLFRDSREGYRRFLKLTNFESSLGEKLAFHFIGFGIGRRRHADREDLFRSLRATGYMGLCITERELYNPLRARDHCRRAIRYVDDSDQHAPTAHYLLGYVNMQLLIRYETCDYLTAAARSYRRVLDINPDLALESEQARVFLESYDANARYLGCSGA